MDNTAPTRRLPAEVEEEILRAISRVHYGSIEIMIHDGCVVQIESREKIRLVRDQPGANGAGRQIPASSTTRRSATEATSPLEPA
ncbi:MAG: YezD family protein [Burkholderiales bacterium]